MQPRLSDWAILLSGSVPSPDGGEAFLRVPEAHLHLDEAVISLARAVFARGGRLIYGGHPSISRLLADVAGEYVSPWGPTGRETVACPPLVVYQSRAFQRRTPPAREPDAAADDRDDYLPEATHLLIRLGLAEVHWTPREGAEEFDPERRATASQQVPRSLQRMRQAMIAEHRPALLAMVCVGGMQGVLDEAQFFLDSGHHLPLYVFPTTGGAAALLAHTRRDRRLRVIPEGWIETVGVRDVMAPSAGAGPPRSATREDAPDPGLSFYAVAMQQIVEELTSRL